MFLQITEISKQFAEKCVLQSVSLTFDKGHCYALCGASGIGKTTLLRILCGLEKQDTGSVAIPPDASFSYAFQEPRLFDALSVAQNIQAVHPDRNIDRLLEDLDLADAMDKYPYELSGGMKKRAGLARALSKTADIYLIDEPTGGQDAQRSHRIAEAIKNYTADSLCIISTHDAALIASIADRLIVLGDGQPRLYDSIREKSADEIQSIMQ